MIIHLLRDLKSIWDLIKRNKMKNQFASPDFLKIVQWNNVRFKVELGLDKKELNQQSICTNRFIEDSDLERFVLKKI